MQILQRVGVVGDAKSLLVIYSACVLFAWHIDSVVGSTDGDSSSLVKPTPVSRLSKTRYNTGKQFPLAHKLPSANFLGSSGKKLGVIRKKSGLSGGFGGVAENSVQPRQGGWGWGWPSSYGGGGGGSYDVYTIIAVAAFAAIFGALIYELLGGNLRRSLDTSPTVNFPSVSLGLDSEKLPDVMVKIGDWIANSAWLDNIGNNSKTIRDFSDKVGIRKWFDAFKKDPVEYQCIRKMACETLASSTLAKNSLKSNLGGVFLAAFGNFMENGDELRGLVNEVVGNPKKCEEMVVGGYCEEN